MAHGRIEAIRSMGDALAEYVQSADDSKFFRGFTREDRPAHFRALLRRANIGSIKAGMSPLFDLDAYVMTFHPDLFEQDEAGSRDWYLTRDLVSIRMTERLFAAGFFAGKSADSLGLDEKETTQS